MGAHSIYLQQQTFLERAKFSLAELESTEQFPDKDQDLYVRRFHEKALDCCYPVEEEVLVNVYFMVWLIVSCLP